MTTTTTESVTKIAQISLPASSHLKPDAKDGSGSGSWPIWRRTLMGSLEDDQVAILTGERPKPPESDPSYAAWQRDNTAIRRAILHSTTDAIHVVDDSIRDSKTIFDTLCKNYAPDDTESNLRALESFLELRLEAPTRSAFFKWELEYRRLTREIITKNIKIEDLITMKALVGLPAGLASLRTATLVRDLDSSAMPSQDQIISLIRSTIFTMDPEGDKQEHSDSTVFTASARSSNSRKQSRPGPHRSNGLVTCFACGATGHSVRQCPDSAKKEAYNRAVTEFRQARLPMSTLATADSFATWVAAGSYSPGSLLIDSGATHHITGDASSLLDYTETPAAPLTGVGHGAVIVGKGHLPLKLKDGTGVLLQNVLHVKDGSFTLISPGRLWADRRISATFGAKAILHRDGTTIATGRRLSNNLYALDASIVTGELRSPLCLAAGRDELTLWHRRYAHLSVDGLKKLARSGHVPELQLALSKSSDVLKCKSCAIGKAAATPFRGEHERSTVRLHRVHSDVLTINTPTSRGLRYILTFVDDYSRKLWIYLLAKKSEVFDKFKMFKAKVELESGCKIVHLHSDNGGEYMASDFQRFLNIHGIDHVRTVPHTPQMNGLAERVNRTLIEGMVTVLNDSGLPHKLWGEAAHYVTAVKNLSPHAGADNDIPARLWAGKMPSAMALRPFGCRAFARNLDPGRRKLDQRARELIFVGFDLNTRAWRLWNPLVKTARSSIVLSRDVKFFEDEFPFFKSLALGGGQFLERNAPPSVRASDFPGDSGYDLLMSSASSVTPAPAAGAGTPAPDLNTPERQRALHAPERQRHASADSASSASSPSPSPDATPEPLVPDRQGTPDMSPMLAPLPLGSSPDPLDMLGSDEIVQTFFASVFTADPEHPAFELANRDPKHWRAAMQDRDSAIWHRQALEEYRSLHEDYKVFDEIPESAMPTGAKLVGSRFVFARKWNGDGEVTGHKARLVAQGFSQREGVDFNETFAPVATMTSVRTVIATAAMEGYVLEQTDVDKAYLHGDLDEEIYMRLPEGIRDQKPPGTVLRLKRALYGLKQAGRAWNQHLKTRLIALGFEQCVSDTCLYRRHRPDGSYEYLLAYVDDLLHAAKTSEMIAETKRGLQLSYGLKTPGRAEYLLGIQIKHNDDGSIFLSQKKYLQDVLARFDMTACHPTKTPMQKDLVLPLPDKDKIDPELKKLYLSAVGSLMYASTSTRPDLAFAVGYLARFSASPTNAHWQAVKTVLRYIKGTLDHGIRYCRGGPDLQGEFHVPRPRDELVAYSDSDWAGCPHTSKSTNGYVFHLAGGPISWSSKLQPRVTLSSVEAEYLGLSHCSKETVNLRQLRTEMGFEPAGPTLILGDNTGAMALSKDPIKASRVRHVRLPEHHVRETVKEGLATVQYVPTSEMAADIFTKPLGPQLFLEHRKRLVTTSTGGV